MILYIFSDDDGSSTEGEGAEDEQDEHATKQKSNATLTKSGWIEKINKNMYKSHRDSKVLEIKMSDLFQQTAEKFLLFLKDAEAKEAEKDKIMKLEKSEKEQLMLELHETVQEKEKLSEENLKLKQENKSFEAEIQKLNDIRDTLNAQISQLNVQYNRAEISSVYVYDYE